MQSAVGQIVDGPTVAHDLAEAPLAFRAGQKFLARLECLIASHAARRRKRKPASATLRLRPHQKIAGLARIRQRAGSSLKPGPHRAHTARDDGRGLAQSVGEFRGIETYFPPADLLQLAVHLGKSTLRLGRREPAAVLGDGQKFVGDFGYAGFVTLLFSIGGDFGPNGGAFRFGRSARFKFGGMEPANDDQSAKNPTGGI